MSGGFGDDATEPEGSARIEGLPRAGDVARDAGLEWPAEDAWAWAPSPTQSVFDAPEDLLPGLDDDPTEPVPRVAPSTSRRARRRRRPVARLVAAAALGLGLLGTAIVALGGSSPDDAPDPSSARGPSAPASTTTTSSSLPATTTTAAPVTTTTLAASTPRGTVVTSPAPAPGPTSPPAGGPLDAVRDLLGG